MYPWADAAATPRAPPELLPTPPPLPPHRILQALRRNVSKCDGSDTSSRSVISRGNTVVAFKENHVLVSVGIPLLSPSYLLIIAFVPWIEDVRRRTQIRSFQLSKRILASDCDTSTLTPKVPRVRSLSDNVCH